MSFEAKMLTIAVLQIVVSAVIVAMNWMILEARR